MSGPNRPKSARMCSCLSARKQKKTFYFLSMEYAGGGGGWRGRPSRSPSPALPLHIEEYPVAGPKAGNSFSPL